MPLRIGQTITPVYVKQHNALFSHRLASLFCPSAARRSLRGTAIFLRDGFATARPIAAVEYRRWGVLIKSFYVTEEIKGAKPVADYWRENLLRLRGSEGRVRRRAVLKKLAFSFKSLHEKKIYHNDLKAANILARQERSAAEVTLSFIDLQGVKRCFYVSKRRRVKNLAQINRSLGCYLSRTEKLTFLRAYVGHAGCDRYKWRPLVRSVIKETNRQMLREKSRHPGTETLPPPQIIIAQAGPGKKIARRWIGGGEHGYSASLRRRFGRDSDFIDRECQCL
jgi:serine/threonine protein kinase